MKTVCSHKLCWYNAILCKNRDRIFQRKGYSTLLNDNYKGYNIGLILILSLYKKFKTREPECYKPIFKLNIAGQSGSEVPESPVPIGN